MAISLAAAAVVVEIMTRGATYSAKDGGVCPVCERKKCRIVRTMEWVGNVRERYHKCLCGNTFKSVQVENQ